MPSRSKDTVTQWQQQPASLEYHLGGISIADDVIEEAIGRLIETDNPHKLYLFGSYARGHPWEPPDLDFLVVEDKGEKSSTRDGSSAGFNQTYAYSSRHIGGERVHF